MRSISETSIEDLPNEILVQIFDHFKPSYLEGVIVLVCRRWHILIKGYNIWKRSSHLGVFCCFKSFRKFEDTLAIEALRPSPEESQNPDDVLQTLVDESKAVINCLGQIKGPKCLHIHPKGCHAGGPRPSDVHFLDFYQSRRKCPRDLNRIGFVVNARQTFLLDILYRIFNEACSGVDLEEVDFSGLLHFGSVFGDLDATFLSRYGFSTESFSSWFIRLLEQHEHLRSLNIADLFSRFEVPMFTELQIRASTLTHLECTVFCANDLVSLLGLINLESLTVHVNSVEFDELSEGFSFFLFEQLANLKLVVDRSPVRNATLRKMFALPPKTTTYLSDLTLLFLGDEDLVPDLGTVLDCFSQCPFMSHLRLHGVFYDPDGAFVPDYYIPSFWSERLKTFHLSTRNNEAPSHDSPLKDFFTDKSIVESLALDSLEWIPADYEDDRGNTLRSLTIYGGVKPACLPPYPNLEALRLASCLSSHSFHRIQNFSKLQHIQLHFVDNRFLTKPLPLSSESFCPSLAQPSTSRASCGTSKPNLTDAPAILNKTLANLFKHVQRSANFDATLDLDLVESVILIDAVPHPQWKVSRCRQVDISALRHSHHAPLHLESSVFVRITGNCRNLRCLEIDCHSFQCDPYSEEQHNPEFASRFGVSPDLVPLLKQLKLLRHCRLRINLDTVMDNLVREELSGCEKSLEPMRNKFLDLERIQLVAFVHWDQLRERERSKFGLSSIVRNISVNCFGCWRRDWQYEKTYPSNVDVTYEALSIP